MKLNDINYNKLAVFCQILDSGNYRRASEVLNVTPSALSQTVTSLEHSLGFPLFHRSGKKLIPTDNARKLHSKFQSHHNQLSHSIQEIVQKKEAIHGVVRIGAYLEFAKTQLAPMMSDFIKKYKDVQIKMAFETPTKLQRLLESGQLDLCFSIYPSVQTRVIESQPVFKEELVLISPKNLLSDKPTLDELLKTPMIEYYLNHQPIQKWIQLHYKKRTSKLPIRAYASTAEMVLAFVKEGAGIGVVPKYILDGKTLNHVQVIRPTERSLSAHIWMLQPKKSSKAPAHVLFAKHALDYFK